MERIKPIVHTVFPDLDCPEGQYFIDEVTEGVKDKIKKQEMLWDDTLGSLCIEVKNNTKER